MHHQKNRLLKHTMDLHPCGRRLPLADSYPPPCASTHLKRALGKKRDELMTESSGTLPSAWQELQAADLGNGGRGGAHGEALALVLAVMAERAKGSGSR